MSLVYLQGSETDKDTIQTKEKLIEIGHSVIVINKLDTNILCRCDYLVCNYFVNYPNLNNLFFRDSSESLYAKQNKIPVFDYSYLPQLPEKEKTMPIFVQMIRENCMNEYREKISKFNDGSLEIGVCNEKV